MYGAVLWNSWSYDGPICSGMGAAFGTAKSVGVASMRVMKPELVMKSIVPVVMIGLLGIYGLIIAVSFRH